MRISDALAQRLGIDGMLNQQAKLSKTQMQLSTGLRVLTPADDPAASIRALDLNETIEKTRQYQDTIAMGRARLSLEESTLDNATHVLQRARELAVQSLNGSLSPQDHQAIEKEVRQLLDEMVGLSNTRSANGEYIFSGFKSNIPAYRWDSAANQYIYQGDDSQRRLQIGPTRQLADGNSGFNVFEAIDSVSTPAASNGGKQSVMTTLYHFAEALKGNVAPPDTAHDALNHSLTDIDSAMERLLEVRTSVGARLNALESQENVNGKWITDAQAVLSETQDLDYAEAISRFNFQSVALQAAQQAYVKVQELSLFRFL